MTTNKIEKVDSNGSLFLLDTDTILWSLTGVFGCGGGHRGRPEWGWADYRGQVRAHWPTSAGQDLRLLLSHH